MHFIKNGCKRSLQTNSSDPRQRVPLSLLMFWGILGFITEIKKIIIYKEMLFHNWFERIFLPIILSDMFWKLSCIVCSNCCTCWKKYSITYLN